MLNQFTARNCFSDEIGTESEANSIQLVSLITGSVHSDKANLMYRRTVACINNIDSSPQAGDIIRANIIKGEKTVNDSMIVEATVCTLSLCTDRYEAFVINGKLRATILDLND